MGSSQTSSITPPTPGRRTPRAPRPPTPSHPPLNTAPATSPWRRAASLLALLALLLLSGAAQAQDALTRARDAARRGDLRTAEAALSPLVAQRDEVQGKVALARLKLHVGDLAGAQGLLTRATQARAEADADKIALGTLKGELEALRGDYPKAVATWSKVLEDFPEATESRAPRLLLGELLMRLGRKSEAEALLDRFADEYNQGLLATSEELTWVGIAVWRMEYYDDANSVLQDAAEKDPGNLRALVAWGELFIEKYNTRDARFAFESALKVNPEHPDALLGLARVHMEESRDLEQVRALIGRALAVNPRHVGALVLSAALQIDVEDYDGAIATLKEALKVNPNDFEALPMLAACHYLKDDARAFEQVKRQALKLNPRWAGFYTTVARLGVQVHRYQEAIELNKQALALDPNHWPAFVELGIGYTRIGDDKKGFEYLLKAHENDPFNARAYNMVELYEKTLDKEYVFVERGALRYRFHRKERGVLERVVPPLVAEAFDKMSRRYRFTPSGPVSVEVFRDVETFSVRSVGLPHISPHGICFGRVVTARSPSAGDFNWAEVLWHEMAHVFHLQMSRSRVPRWFTEGLAEYEAGVARPEWRREHDMEVLVLLRDGRLWSVERLNLGFTQARTIQEIVTAYYQSTLVIEFIVDRWGDDAILALLKHFGQSKTTPDALKAVTRLDTRGFDAAFEGWLRKRYATLLASFEPVMAAYEDLDRYELAASQAPKDAAAQADLAMAYFVARRLDQAQAQLKRALTLDPKQPTAHYLAALYELRTRNHGAARRHLESILKAGRDGYSLRLRLGELARAEGKIEEATAHYKRAAEIYPRGIDAHRVLAELYLKAGDKVAAADAMEGVSRIDEMDMASALKLVEVRRGLGQTARARDAAVRTLHIDPFNGEGHLARGRVELEVGKPADAVVAFELAVELLKGGVDTRAAAWRGLALARWKAGDKPGARDALKEAERLDPRHPELGEVRGVVK